MYMITGESVTETINVYASLEGVIKSAALQCKDFYPDDAKKELLAEGIHVVTLKDDSVFPGKGNVAIIRKIEVNA